VDEFRGNEAARGLPTESTGVVSWMVGVFADPSATFASLTRHVALPHPSDSERMVDRTRWWAPVVLLVVIGVGVASYTVPHFVVPMQEQAVREAVADRGLSPEQVEEAVRMARTFTMPSAVLGAVVGTFATLFVVAGIVHLLTRAVGGKGTFRNARAVVAYSMLVSGVGSLVKLPLMISKKSPFVETSLALFRPDLEPSDKLYKLLNGFDIFTVWWIVLLVVGLAAGYRVSRARAAAVVVGLWIIVLIVSMHLPTGGALGVSG